MANICDLTNTPINLTVNGKLYKVKSLSMKEIIGQFEALVSSDYDTDTLNIAKSLEGDDKFKFLIQRGKDKPKGNALYGQAIEYTQTFEGLFVLLKDGLNKFQKVEDEEVSALINNAGKYEMEFTRLISHLLGTGSDSSNGSEVEDKKKQ